MATNSADSSWLKASPFAPNGGYPCGVRSGSDFQAIAAPPAAPVFQMMPCAESET